GGVRRAVRSGDGTARRPGRPRPAPARTPAVRGGHGPGRPVPTGPESARSGRVMSAAVGYAGTTCAGVAGGGGLGRASPGRGSRRTDPAASVPEPAPMPVPVPVPEPVPTPVAVVTRPYRKQGLS